MVAPDARAATELERPEPDRSNEKDLALWALMEVMLLSARGIRLLTIPSPWPDIRIVDHAAALRALWLQDFATAATPSFRVRVFRRVSETTYVEE